MAQQKKATTDCICNGASTMATTVAQKKKVKEMEAKKKVGQAT